MMDVERVGGTRRLTRRALLVSSLGVAVGLGLAACAPTAPAPSKPAEPTKPADPAKPAEAAKPAAPAAPAQQAPAQATAPAPAAVQPALKPVGSVVADRPSRSSDPNPKRGGEIRMAQNGTAAHFDLAQGSSAPTKPLYNRLLKRDPADGNRTIITDLATSVEPSADSKVYTFKLRQGVKFHDGTPFTADDVVASLKRQLDPPQGVIPTFKAILGPITAVDAIDPATVRITLSKPYFPFLDVLAADGPGIIYSKKTLDENGGDLKKVIAPGTGPYKFTEHKQGEYWLFDKNPDYFDKEIPYADKMRWLHVPIADDRGTAVLTGRADFTSNAGLQTWLEGQKRPDVVKGIHTKGIVRTAAIFNTKKKPFDDKRVRKAIHLAWNRADMSAVSGRFEPTSYSRWVPHGDAFEMPEDEIKKLPGYQPQTPPEVIQEAKKLLADAGFPDGIKGVDFIAIRDHYTINGATAMQDWLKRLLNIEANLRAMDRTQVLQEEAAGNFDICFNWKETPGGISDFGLYAALAFKTGGGNNTGSYSNPELDKLIDEILSELDKEKRTVLIRKAEDLLDDESPWVGNGFNGHGLFWRNELKGMGFEKRIITLGDTGFEVGWFDK
jgi:peptide/nickel transport system substrate-binding protein